MFEIHSSPRSFKLQLFFSLQKRQGYIPILKKIITLGKSYYPEVAETVTVIRAPGFCTMFYNLVKPLLPKLLQKKICLLSQNFHEGIPGPKKEKKNERFVTSQMSIPTSF